MTDDEIIKALDCERSVGLKCSECPLRDYEGDCSERAIEDAFDLVVRQKNEIEKLQHHCFGIQNELEAYKDTFNTAIDEVKSEATKAFAERLKEQKYCAHCWVVSVSDIDNLAKRNDGGAKMKSKWYVMRNSMAGYIVARVKDTSEVVHSGNLEFYGKYSDNKKEQQVIADKLNKGWYDMILKVLEMMFHGCLIVMDVILIGYLIWELRK